MLCIVEGLDGERCQWKERKQWLKTRQREAFDADWPTATTYGEKSRSCLKRWIIMLLYIPAGTHTHAHTPTHTWAIRTRQTEHSQKEDKRKNPGSLGWNLLLILTHPSRQPIKHSSASHTHTPLHPSMHAHPHTPNHLTMATSSSVWKLLFRLYKQAWLLKKTQDKLWSQLRWL